jgi:hypothetical protein
MKRMLLLLGLVAAVLVVPATAAAFNGVVVAKQPKRDALVIASHGGVVRTVRATARRVRAIRTGQRLVYSARKLSDGTFAARAIRVTGRSRHATLHGIVVRQRAGHILLSTGGSLVTVRSSARGFAAVNGRHRAGDVVLARVTVTRSGLRASSIRTLGHEDGMELEGIFLGVNGNQLRLAVEDRGEVFVTVPDGFQLPPLSPGDEVELVVSVDASGAFTLVTIQTDDENDDDNEGINEEDGRVEVKGLITSLTGGVTVQPEGGSPVTCAVPDGFDLSGFSVNDRVEMKCRLVNGQLTLRKLEHDDEDDDNGDDNGEDGGGGDD